MSVFMLEDVGESVDSWGGGWSQTCQPLVRYTLDVHLGACVEALHVHLGLGGWAENEMLGPELASWWGGG